MKKLKILFITALFSISLFSCNSNKSSSQVYDIDPGLDSLWFSYKLATELTEGGMVSCRPSYFRDSIENHEVMSYFLDKVNPYFPLESLVSQKVSMINLGYDPEPYEIVGPWVTDTTENGAEFSSVIYKVPKTNTAIYVLVVDVSGGGGFISITEFHGYWNNQNINIADCSKLIISGYLSKEDNK